MAKISEEKAAISHQRESGVAAAYAAYQ